MINTINISLPNQLKLQAESLINAGYYASFSDLARTAIRNILSVNQNDLWADEAESEMKSGKTKILKNQKEIDSYLDSIVK
jgi:Arc/MetJ-type ribon-helix-helix transcriptional regulator